MCVCGATTGSVTVQTEYVIAPTMDYTKPQEAQTEAWRRSLEREWGNLEPVAHGEAEDEWREFCAKLEQACGQARRQLEPLRRPPHCRNKGSMPYVVVEAHNAKVQDSFRLRRLSKLLGRASELDRQRRREHASTSNILVLERKLVRGWPADLPRPHHGQNPVDILREAYDQELQQRLRQRLRQWRHRVGSAGKAATRWLARVAKPKPPALQIRSDTGEVSYTQGTDEQLRALGQFWRHVWDRELPDRQRAVEQWLEHVQPSNILRGMDIADFVTGENLQKAASGSAAGPDGWSGDEMIHLPLPVYDEFATLLLRWFSRKNLPRVLRGARQVHLPKDIMDACSNSLPPEKMRPLSVFSCWWRLVGTTLAHHPAIQRWASDLLPLQQHGAVSGRSLFGAIRDLGCGFHDEKGVLVSLDLKQAFDRTDPSIGLDMMRRAGMPQTITDALGLVWTNQLCWLQLGRYSRQRVEAVHTSLPQGDGMCPLCLNMVMLGPVMHFLREFSLRDMKLAVFLDDRTFVARTSELAVRGQQFWQQWSQRLGWQENEAKTKFVCREPSSIAALQAMQVPPEAIVDQARVLGVDFTGKLRQAARATEEERKEGALEMARRLANAPLSTGVKRHLWTTRVIPKAAWGSLFRQPTTKVCAAFQRWFRQAFYVHKMGSPDIQVLLEGHAADYSYQANAKAVAEFSRVVSAQTSWRGQLGSWFGHVRRFLQGLGWQQHEVGRPQRWRHDELGYDATIGNNLNQFQHQLRETWRLQKWKAFINSDRRDAAQLRGLPYNGRRLQRARMLFQRGDGHQRAVMCGAALSTAFYEKRVSGAPSATCAWCGAEEPAGWDHLVWRCSAFQGRPVQPRDGLQRRLGWPQERDSPLRGREVLQWMASIRRAVLQAL